MPYGGKKIAALLALGLAACVVAVPIHGREKGAQLSSMLGSPGSMDLCKQCQRIVGELQGDVMAINSTYSARIQDFFNTKICPQMPPDSQKACTDFANTELPKLWEEAVDEVLDPETACTEMNLCGKQADALGDIVTCKLCKKAAKYVDKKKIGRASCRERV